MTRFLLTFALIIGLSGCGVVRNTVGGLGIGKSAPGRAVVESDGTKFRARAKAESDDKRLITITVTPFAVDPERAVAAGRYQATRYCLLTYGGSDKIWIVGPDDDISTLPVEDDTVTMQARCTQR